MCEVCKTAHGELEQFAEQLVEKYPGTEVRGQAVPRTHHVMAALVALAEKYLYLEVMAAAEAQQAELGAKGIKGFLTGPGVIEA
jgi:hypothetical protein